MISTVLVDWAGTITIPLVELVTAAAERAEVDLAVMASAFAGYQDRDDQMVHRAERGEIDDEEFLEWVAAQAPGAERLFDLDEPSLLNAPERPQMIELLGWLQDQELVVMLATNNFAMAQEMLATRYLDRGLVNAVINSALVGTRKPDDGFWDLALEAAMADPGEVLLIDDDEKNIAAASARGIHTVAVDEHDINGVIQEVKATISGSDDPAVVT